jgi:hypothetical protein
MPDSRPGKLPAYWLRQDFLRGRLKPLTFPILYLGSCRHPPTSPSRRPRARECRSPEILAHALHAWMSTPVEN